MPWLDLLSVEFIVLYAFCGITDVLDGVLARRWGVESEWGSRLDSIADLLFYSAMVTKIVPFLIEKRVHYAVWVVAGTAVLLRLAAYLLVAFKFRRFASVHTYANKLTGLAIFSLPFLLYWGNLTAAGLFAGAVGVFSSLEELLIHALSNEYNPNKKSLFFR